MVTQALRPSFGEVKSLIETKSRIPLKSFDELEEMGKYVAVGGKERFRMSKDGGCYLTPEEKKATNTYYTEQARASLNRPKKKNIFVMANGRTQTLPCKVVFGELEIVYWHSMLSIIAETLDIPQGIQCLYDVYGNATPDPRTLGNGCIYVAVAPNETFASIDYVGAFQNLLPMREIDMVKIEGIFETQPSTYNPPRGASKTSMGSSRMKLAGGRMPNRNIPDPRAESPRLRQILGVNQERDEAVSNIIPANHEDAEKQRAKERERESRERIKLLSNTKLRTMPTSGISPLPKIDEVIRSSIDTGSCDLDVDSNAPSEPIILNENARSASQLFESPAKSQKRSAGCKIKSPSKTEAQNQKNINKSCESLGKRTIQTQKSAPPQSKTKVVSKVLKKPSKTTQTKCTESKKTETKCTESKKTETKGIGTSDTKIKNTCQAIGKLEPKEQCQNLNSTKSSIGTIILKGFGNQSEGPCINKTQSLKLPCNMKPEVFFRTKSGINIGISLLCLEPKCPCSNQSSSCSNTMECRQIPSRGCNNKMPTIPIISGNTTCTNRNVPSHNTNHIIMPCNMGNDSNFQDENDFLPKESSKNNVIDKDWPLCIPYPTGAIKADSIMPKTGSCGIPDGIKKDIVAPSNETCCAPGVPTSNPPEDALLQSKNSCVQDTSKNKTPDSVTPGCGGGTIKDNQKTDMCQFCGQPSGVILPPIPKEDKCCTSDVPKTNSCGKDNETETVDLNMPGFGSCAVQDNQHSGSTNVASSKSNSAPTCSTNVPIKDNLADALPPCQSIPVEDSLKGKVAEVNTKTNICGKDVKTEIVDVGMPGCGSCAVQDNQNTGTTHSISYKPNSVPTCLSQPIANQGSPIKDNIVDTLAPCQSIPVEDTSKGKMAERKTKTNSCGKDIQSETFDVAMPGSGSCAVQDIQHIGSANVVSSKLNSASTRSSQSSDNKGAPIKNIKVDAFPLSQSIAAEDTLKGKTAKVKKIVTLNNKSAEIILPGYGASSVQDNKNSTAAKPVMSKSTSAPKFKPVAVPGPQTKNTTPVARPKSQSDTVQANLKSNTANLVSPKSTNSAISKSTVKDTSRYGGSITKDNQNSNIAKDVSSRSKNSLKSKFIDSASKKSIESASKKSIDSASKKSIDGALKKSIDSASKKSTLKPQSIDNPACKGKGGFVEVVLKISTTNDTCLPQLQAYIVENTFKNKNADDVGAKCVGCAVQYNKEDVLAKNKIVLEPKPREVEEALRVDRKSNSASGVLSTPKNDNKHQAINVGDVPVIKQGVDDLKSQDYDFYKEMRMSTDTETSEIIDSIKLPEGLDNTGLEKLRALYDKEVNKNQSTEELLPSVNVLDDIIPILEETRASTDTETSEIIDTTNIPEGLDMTMLEKLRVLYDKEVNKESIEESLPTANLTSSIKPLQEETRSSVDSETSELVFDSPGDFIDDIIQSCKQYIERSSITSEHLDTLEKLQASNPIYNTKQLKKKVFIEKLLPNANPVKSDVPSKEKKKMPAREGTRISRDTETSEIVYNSPKEFIDDIINTSKVYVERSSLESEHLDNLEKLQTRRSTMYPRGGAKKNYFIGGSQPSVNLVSGIVSLDESTNMFDSDSHIDIIEDNDEDIFSY